MHVQHHHGDAYTVEEELSRKSLVSIGIEVETRRLDTEKLAVEVLLNFVVFNLFVSKGESCFDPRILLTLLLFLIKCFSENKPPYLGRDVVFCLAVSL